jgi:2-dehydro-3-deoxygluconokinase
MSTGPGTPGVLTFGETMALFTPGTVGALAHVDGFRLSIGGAESNVAIGVTRLGGRATWIGRVGDDSLGEVVTRELLAERIDARALVDSAARTGLMVKERRTAGSTSVAYYRDGSAGSRLEPADLDDELIRAAGVLHITGITPALSASAADTVRAAIDIAADAGVPVSFDVNHRSALWEQDAATREYLALAARATILFAGDDEAELLVGGGAPPALAARLADLGPSQVIVKLGARGCSAHIDGVAYDRAAIPVQPTDTVGAGDAFVAGYLTELLAGEPPSKRLDTALRCGAFACLGPGDWESYPRRGELGLLDAVDPVRR